MYGMDDKMVRVLGSSFDYMGGIYIFSLLISFFSFGMGRGKMIYLEFKI